MLFLSSYNGFKQLFLQFQYWQQASSFNRHGHLISNLHLLRLQGNGKSVGNWLVLFMMGTRLVSFMMGTRLVSFMMGTRLVSFVMGTRLVSFVMGTRLVSFTMGTRFSSSSHVKL